MPCQICNGPVRYTAHDKKQARNRPFDHKVGVRSGSDVKFPTEEELPIAEVYWRLMVSKPRNLRVAKEVVAVFKEGRCPLVLTERTHHLEILRELIEPEVERLVVLKGGLGKKKLAKITAKLDEWKDLSHIVLATGRYPACSTGASKDMRRLGTRLRHRKFYCCNFVSFCFVTNIKDFVWGESNE